MPPTIPDELIQLVVDNLAEEIREGRAEDLLSCSLANKVLRHAAQTHLFETVQLWPSPPSLQDPPPDQAARDERALLFIQLLKKNPALGVHVRRLDYQVNQFPRNDEDRLDDLLQAIEMMPNVTNLTLGYRKIVIPWTEGRLMPRAPIPRELVFQDRRGISGEDPHSRWKCAVVALIQRTGLKTLRLARIRMLPLHSLSPSIRTLSLQDSSFSLDRAVEPFETRCVKLESLNCEDDEAVNFVDDYLKAEEVGLPLPITLDLSGLRRLGIMALCGYHERWGRVFRQINHLRELEVSVHRLGSLITEEAQPEIALEGFSINPVSLILPTSLATIPHLTLKFYMDHRYSDFIVDPYTRVCDDNLLLLGALENLEIDMVLCTEECDPLADNLKGSGRGWEQLPVILAAQGSFPRLRKVSVRVQATMEDYSEHTLGGLDPGEIEGYKREVEWRLVHAQKLVEEMADLVFPRKEFRSLVDMRPRLELSLVTEVTMGYGTWRSRADIMSK